MASRNVKLIDKLFEVLNLISISLPAPWWWQTEDLDQGMSGAVFRCYEDGNEQELAYLLIVDVSKSRDEPDISQLQFGDVDKVDLMLERAAER